MVVLMGLYGQYQYGFSHFSKGRELVKSVCTSRGSVWDAKEERRVLLEMW